MLEAQIFHTYHVTAPKNVHGHTQSECKLNPGFTLSPAVVLTSGQSFGGRKQTQARAFQKVSCHLLKTLVTSCLQIYLRTSQGYHISLS